MAVASTNPATLRRVKVPNERFDKMVASHLRKLSGDVVGAYRTTDPKKSIGTPLYTTQPTNSGMVYIHA